MMDEFTAKPKVIRAVQWDGSKAQMHIIVGMLLSLGHEARIESGYESQGPDLISIRTQIGYVRVYPKDYIIKDGAYLNVMTSSDFVRDYERTAV